MGKGIQEGGLYVHNMHDIIEELDSLAVCALNVRSWKLSNALNGQSWDG
jgi:hypothetical protein